MTKTVQIDDDVMLAAEKIAAERGATPDAVISEAARKLLIEQSVEGPAGSVLENGWYVLPKRDGPPVTHELVQHLLEEADLKDAGAERSRE